MQETTMKAAIRRSRGSVQPVKRGVVPISAGSRAREKAHRRDTRSLRERISSETMHGSSPRVPRVSMRQISANTVIAHLPESAASVTDHATAAVR